jgi:hypothetical protein
LRTASDCESLGSERDDVVNRGIIYQVRGCPP